MRVIFPAKYMELWKAGLISAVDVVYTSVTTGKGVLWGNPSD